MNSSLCCPWALFVMDGEFRPSVILSPSTSGLAVSFDSKSRWEVMKRVAMFGHVMLFERQVSSTLSVGVYTSSWSSCIGSLLLFLSRRGWRRRNDRQSEQRWCRDRFFLWKAGARPYQVPCMCLRFQGQDDRLYINPLWLKPMGKQVEVTRMSHVVSLVP